VFNIFSMDKPLSVTTKMDETVIQYERKFGFRNRGWTTSANFAQVFFQVPDSDTLPKCDVLFCLQIPAPFKGHYNWPFSTLVLDLERSESSILGAMKPETRRQIRQMERSQAYVTDIIPNPSGALIDEFCTFYDTFARLKGVEGVHPEEIYAIARQQRLVLGCARDEGGRAVVWHAYYRGATRAVQLCSASHFRNAASPSERATVGKANRWLHWQEVLYFRRTEIAMFDFGGWYAGSSDQALLRINKFKEEFGGSILHEWNSRLGCSAKGKAFVATRRWHDRFTGMARTRLEQKW
jgi:hypothetical protein